MDLENDQGKELVCDKCQKIYVTKKQLREHKSNCTGKRRKITAQPSGPAPNASTTVTRRDFKTPDELSNLTLLVEGQKLFTHREVLAMHSPVFKAMFLHDFKEKRTGQVQLSDKKIGDIVHLLNCIYPPSEPITDSNVNILLRLAQEYQMDDVMKRCEDYLLTKCGSTELLYTAQMYDLERLLKKNIVSVSEIDWTTLQADRHFKALTQGNVLYLLEGRVQYLERKMVDIEQNKSEIARCIQEISSNSKDLCFIKKKYCTCTMESCSKTYRHQLQSKINHCVQLSQSIV